MTQVASHTKDAIRNDTEERLLESALSLFAARGYAATSVREIIEATGVTRPVLYYYCDSKRDLFERVVRWKHGEAHRALHGLLAVEASTPSRLRAIARGTFAFCAADPRVPQLMFQSTYGPVDSEIVGFLQGLADTRFAAVAEVMQAGIDRGELRGGASRSLTLLFCSLVDYHANTLSRLPAPAGRLTPELADALVDAFLHGAGAGRRTAPELPDALG